MTKMIPLALLTLAVLMSEATAQVRQYYGSASDSSGTTPWTEWRVIHDASGKVKGSMTTDSSGSEKRTCELRLRSGDERTDLERQMSAYCGAGYCPRPYAAACHRGRRRGDRVPYSIAIAGSGHRFLIAHILRRATWIQGCRTPWVFHHFPLSGPEEAPAKKIRKRPVSDIRTAV
jgi:hypothetical protein